MESYLRKKIKLKTNKRKNKRWTEDEVNLILNYMQQVPEVEMPSAQAYYTKLIENTGLNASWGLIRWKMRHLKSLFLKTHEWRMSTDAKELEATGVLNLETRLLRMCPHYKQLNAIYGVRTTTTNNIFEITEISDSTTVDESICSIINEPISESPTFIESKVEFDDNVLMENDAPLEVNAETTAALEETCIKQRNEKSADDPIALRSGKVKYYTKKAPKSAPMSTSESTKRLKMQLDWKKEKHYNEMKLKERQLKLKEDKLVADVELRRQELELRMQEIEKEERLKMHSIEKDERVEKYEIEMRYRYQMQ